MSTTHRAAPAILTRDLVKTFGKTRALDGLDLHVAHGEIHGFLGPNGAGKSTTIRILLGTLKATSGKAELLGGDPWKDAVGLHRRLAYVPGDVELWPNLTGGEAIDVFARLRGGIDPARRSELIERFELDPRKKGRAYSKGNRQKVALVAALASDAELLILDEPTSGLDPLMEVQFQECVREAAGRGATVLLSSHIMAQVEALADRVSIVREGKIVESGTLEQMRHLSRTTVTLDSDLSAAQLESFRGVHSVHSDGNRFAFDADPAELPSILGELSRSQIRSFKAAPPSLEQLLLRYYGPGADDAAPHARTNTHRKEVES